MDWTDLPAATISEVLSTSTFVVADQPNVPALLAGAFKTVDVSVLKRLFGTPDIQVFSTAGSFTWTKPENAQLVDVLIVGGGGGGASGRRGADSSNRGGGGGGAPGAVTRHIFEASQLGATVAVFVGSGGAGGAGTTVDDTNGSGGTAGEASTFGTFPAAVGGNGGGLGSNGGGGSAGPAKNSSIIIYNSTAGNGNSGTAGGLTNAATPTASNAHIPTGGGGGGGINAANVVGNGGPGQDMGNAANLLRAAPTTPGDPGNVSIYRFGTGGAGGNASASANAQAGGNGSVGGGGGGGGASLNGFNSGAGGAGGNGLVIVITR